MFGASIALRDKLGKKKGGRAPQHPLVQKMGGNETQQRQHAVIRMDIALNLLQKYHDPIIPETGTQIQYDIQKLKKIIQKQSNSGINKGKKKNKQNQTQYLNDTMRKKSGTN